MKKLVGKFARVSTKRRSKPLGLACATFLCSWPGVLRQLRCVYKISPTLADTLTMKSHI